MFCVYIKGHPQTSFPHFLQFLAPLSLGRVAKFDTMAKECVAVFLYCKLFSSSGSADIIRLLLKSVQLDFNTFCIIMVTQTHLSKSTNEKVIASMI